MTNWRAPEVINTQIDSNFTPQNGHDEWYLTETKETELQQ